MAVLLAEIMDAPDFGEVMFLVGFILFLFAAWLAHPRQNAWPVAALTVLAIGLAAVALGWLALPTDPTP